jgi:hypothetical protein
MKKAKSKRGGFDQLTDARKEAIYQQCERVGADDGEPLTARDLQLHRKAHLPVGRPRVGQGAERINISMERGLLKIADSVARKKGMTRARLIAESVRAYIAGAA